MTSRWTIGALLAGAVGLMLTTAPARVVATTCQGSCATLRTAVAKHGLTGFRACQRSCRAAGDRSSCTRSCRATAIQARRAAKTTAAECLQSCIAGDSCEQQCTAPLQACVEPLADRAWQCTQACAATVRDAAEACLRAPNPGACLGQIPQQALRCAQSCETAADQAVQACRASFGSCVASCPPSPCRNGCLGSLAGCLTPIQQGAESCLGGCVTAALQAGAACLGQADPQACFDAVAQGFAQCGQGCETSAQEAIDACGSAATGCFQDCQPAGGCRDLCVVSGQGCLEPVVSDVKTCAEGCGTATFQKAVACFGGSDIVACLTDVAKQAVQCGDGCKTAAYQAGDSCRLAFEGCVDACPADACRDGCATSLESCIGTDAGQADSCVSSCIGGAYSQGGACLPQPDAGACLVGVGRRFVACAGGCEGTALQGAEGCKASFLSCQTACGGASGK